LPNEQLNLYKLSFHQSVTLLRLFTNDSLTYFKQKIHLLAVDSQL